MLLLKYPIEGLMNILLMWINCFSWAGGRPCFKRSFAEVSIEFEELDYFLNLVNLIGVVFRFSNGLGYKMPCGLLIGYRENRTHLRARDSCHISTFPGRGVIVMILFLCVIKLLIKKLFKYVILKWINKLMIMLNLTCFKHVTHNKHTNIRV